MPRSAVPIPDNESPDDRFRRLATQRTRRALDDLRKLGNLAQNVTLYDYDDDDVQRIMDALRGRLDEVQLQFEAGLRRRGRSGRRSSGERFAL